MNNQDFRLNISDYLYIFKYTLSYRNMSYTVTHFKYDNSRNSKHAILVIDSKLRAKPYMGSVIISSHFSQTYL